MKRLFGSCILIAAMPASSSTVLAQGVDYHKAQQAGRVWQKKGLKNGRLHRRTETNSKGVAYNAPVTDADRQFVLASAGHRYDRLLRSVGKKNADRWLEQMARIERAKR
jgi:hypothetical protein